MTNPARPKLIIHKRKPQNEECETGQDTKNATKLWESEFKSPVHAGPQP